MEFLFSLQLDYAFVVNIHTWYELSPRGISHGRLIQNRCVGFILLGKEGVLNISEFKTCIKNFNMHRTEMKSEQLITKLFTHENRS